MKIHAKLLCLGALSWSSIASAQKPVELAPNAPADRPLAAAWCQWRAAVKAMQPYVDRARATFRPARARFLAGLPPRHTMFVTTRLRDDRGLVEQVFVVVDTIAGNSIRGRIWSDIGVVIGYRRGQPYVLHDSALVDWMIAKPDGSEEGNLVGKFLDTYRPPTPCREDPADPSPH